MLNVYTSLSLVTTHSAMWSLKHVAHHNVADDETATTQSCDISIQLPMKTTVSVSIAARILFFSWHPSFELAWPDDQTATTEYCDISIHHPMKTTVSIAAHILLFSWDPRFELAWHIRRLLHSARAPSCWRMW